MSKANKSLREIFNEAVEIEDAQQRDEYLAAACGDDIALRQSIEELIDANNTAGPFLGGAGNTAMQDARNAPGDTVLIPALTERPEDHTIRRFGDYELLEEIARGGMGIVYRARQVSLDRIVAVKLLLLGQYASEELIHRFRIEASAAASLQHPNIVAIHEVGVHEGQHYFAMDFVDGPTLARLILDQPLSAKRAAGYVKTIAEAIHFAHTRGILHRDLKPSNVLIDSNDRPRVTDFGLAKNLSADSDLTLTGQVMGSPSFMPPEQASGERGKVGPVSDIYSLGAILYHALTGRPPFVGQTTSDILHQVLSLEPVSPCLLKSGVPDEIATISLKCLEKEPSKRYQTAQELADEIGRFLKDEPILARSLSWTNFNQTLWASSEFRQGYLDEADAIVPDRRYLFHVLHSFLRHFARSASLRICDLGCGDGILGQQLLVSLPGARLTLVDGSASMLDAARRRVNEGKNVRFLQAAFEAIIRGEVQLGPFDFIVSSLAIHHLTQAERVALFFRAIEQLEPGGWFLNMDVVLPDEPVLLDWQYELWREWIIETEKHQHRPKWLRDTPDETRRNPDNKLSRLASQLNGLRSAGFVDVDCLYRNGIFVIYCGRKPA